MTNEQKYKTEEERIKAFDEFCDKQGRCDSCKIVNGRRGGIFTAHCMAYWLALQHEDEKQMPCPFCGSVCGTTDSTLAYNVYCKSPNCSYMSGTYETREAAISAHNRVCREMKATKESEVN